MYFKETVSTLSLKYLSAKSDQKWENVKILLTYPPDPLKPPPREPPTLPPEQKILQI